MIGKALLMCEETQAVCKELRGLGWEAYSCDLLPCSGGKPEWHIQDDGLKVAKSQNWDLIISFPPCTDLAVSGAAHFAKKRANGSQYESIKLFLQMAEISNATENPVGIMSGSYIKQHFPDLYEMAQKIGFPRKPDQIIEPYQFGDPVNKKTCLWLRGLPKLVPTKIVKGSEYITAPSGRRYPAWCWYSGKGKGQQRSRTYPGIAKAMAEQWTAHYVKEVIGI